MMSIGSVEARLPQFLPLHLSRYQLEIACANQPDRPTSDQILREFSMSVQGGNKGAATLNTVEKVEAYVDKKVRKELLEAMR